MVSEQLRPYFRYAGLEVTDYARGHFSLSPQMIFELRQLEYFSQWKTSIDKSWFHVRLADHSLFTFSSQGANLSYSFLACPLEIPTLREFLSERGLEVNRKNVAEHVEEYGLVIDTAMTKPTVTPIRYDLDRNAYRTCIHPAAHIHIGLSNEVRIATRRELSPLAFVLFVIRQAYPENWARLFEYQSNLKIGRRLREDLPEVIAPHWQGHDELQAYLF